MSSHDKYTSQPSKQRLLALFVEIEKEFDILVEENNDLKRRIAFLENKPPTSEHVHRAPESPRLLRRNKEKEKEKDRKDHSKKNLSIDVNPIGQSYPQKSDFWVHTQDLNGHRDGVWEVSSCPWSLKRIGSASFDRTARVWTMTPNYPQLLYVGHTGAVNSIRFHPKDRFVCTASGDRTCHIWKIPSIAKKDKESIKHQKGVQKNSNKLWSPLLANDDSNDSNFYNYNYNDSNENSPPGNKSATDFMGREKEASHSNSNPSVNMFGNYDSNNNNNNNSNPDFNNNAFDVSDITLNTPLTILLGHYGPVIAAEWITNVNSIASVSWDNSIALWDSEGTKISSIENVHEDGHVFMNINRNNDISSGLTVTASSDGVIRVWDLRTSKSALHSILAHESSVNSACFSQVEEMTIFSGGDDRCCRSWDLRQTKQPINVIRCSSAINRFSISPISSTIAIPMDDRRTKLCDVQGNRLGNLRSHDKGEHTAVITATAWSNDESVVYTSSFTRQNSIIAWTKDSPKRSKKIDRE